MPHRMPDLVLSEMERVEELDDSIPYGGTIMTVEDGIFMCAALSWTHVHTWFIAEALHICKTYPKSVRVKKRFKINNPHKPVFEMSTMLANLYLDYIGESMRFVQVSFPGDGTKHVTLTVHGGGLHRLMFDTEVDHPWVMFLSELMLKEQWLDKCAKMAASGGTRRPIVTVYRDIANNYQYVSSKWSYTHG